MNKMCSDKRSASLLSNNKKVKQIVNYAMLQLYNFQQNSINSGNQKFMKFQGFFLYLRFLLQSDFSLIEKSK